MHARETAALAGKDSAPPARFIMEIQAENLRLASRAPICISIHLPACQESDPK